MELYEIYLGWMDPLLTWSYGQRARKASVASYRKRRTRLYTILARLAESEEELRQEEYYYYFFHRLMKKLDLIMKPMKVLIRKQLKDLNMLKASVIAGN